MRRSNGWQIPGRYERQGIRLIKVENRSEKEISKTGRRIGEAFAAEKEGLVTLLTPEQTVKMFEIITEYYYRAGVLYTT